MSICPLMVLPELVFAGGIVESQCIQTGFDSQTLLWALQSIICVMTPNGVAEDNTGWCYPCEYAG